MNDFLNLKQGGFTVATYEQKIMELFGYGSKLGESQLACCFVRGLRDELRY